MKKREKKAKTGQDRHPKRRVQKLVTAKKKDPVWGGEVRAKNITFRGGKGGKKRRVETKR